MVRKTQGMLEEDFRKAVKARRDARKRERKQGMRKRRVFVVLKEEEEEEREGKEEEEYKREKGIEGGEVNKTTANVIARETGRKGRHT